MAVQYSVDVQPRTGILGGPVTAVLRCTAKGDTPGVMTFEHKSLVLELDSQQLLEPHVAFPNRFAVEAGGRLIRTSLPGGIEDLRDGEQRSRTFDLPALFSGPLFTIGTISFTYRLEDAQPPVRPEPVTVELQSGPEAVLLLIECLNSASPDVRFRASELLGRMTAQHFAGTTEWSAWWGAEGSRLPWNYESEGATFGARPSTPIAPPRRSAHLGGIQYPAGAHE